MIRLRSAAAVIVTATVFASLGTSPAQAGNVSAGGAVTVTWDDSKIYAPTSCSSYVFSYTQTSDVLMTTVHIVNKYGDQIASGMLTETGATTLQVCTGYDLIETKLQITVTFKGASGRGDAVGQTPITFLPRGSAASSPSEEIAALKREVTAIKAALATTQKALSTANWKLKKICAAKPKPKGC